MNLTPRGGGATRTTISNGLGDFRFDGVPPGDYTVAEAPAIGWINVSPTQVEVTVIAGESVQQRALREPASDADAYEHPYPDADEYANQYTHADEHTYATPTNTATPTQPHTHADEHTYSHADEHRHPDANLHAHGDT